jgi:hypothetical protein
LLSASVYASTPNTVAAGAVSYEVGAGWVTDGVDEGNQNRWFAFLELAGRSYCVEATLGPATYFALDPGLTLYSDSAGTVVYLTNADGAAEPPQYRGSRVCYQSPLAIGGTQVRLFKVNVPVAGGSGDTGFLRARVIDTTLIFPVFWLKNDAAGGPAKSVTAWVANTTTTDINGAIYVPGYGAVATYNTSTTKFKAPNQSTATGNLARKDVSAPSGVPSWNWQGTVYLTHDGPPGALEAWVDTFDPAATSTVIRVYANPR